MVLLRPVQVGTHTQPVGQVILSRHAQRSAPATLQTEVVHVLQVHRVDVVAGSSRYAHTPLRKCCRSAANQDGGNHP